MIGDIYQNSFGYYDGKFVVTKTHTESKIDLWSICGGFSLHEINIDNNWKKMPSYTLKMIGNYFELISFKLLNEKILEQFCGFIAHLKIVSNLNLQKGNPLALQINSGNEDVDLRLAMEILNILKDDVILI